MSVSATERLRHIQQEIAFLAGVCAGKAREDVLGDPVRERAVIRSLEIVGEAARALPPEFHQTHPEIEWRKVGGMRDRLIHGYFSVNHDIVWDVITVHIPKLAIVVNSALAENEQSE